MAASPSVHYTDPATQEQSKRVWSLFNSVEAEALVNALRRWQSSFGLGRNSFNRTTTVNDPYVRLILDRYAKQMFSLWGCSIPVMRLVCDEAEQQLCDSAPM